MKKKLIIFPLIPFSLSDLYSKLFFQLLLLYQIIFAVEFVNYTYADGLPWDCIHSIAIDSSGNKWFGTWGPGYAIKFDGNEWTSYSIGIDTTTNTVYDIIVYPEGNIWFSCRGLKKFDGDTTWVEFAIYAHSIEIDLEGNMWFGCWMGVYKYDGISWTFYDTSDGLAGEYVNAIAIDSKGNKWFGTDQGVSKFDGNSWITYTTSDGLIDNYITDIAIDMEDNKWFGTGGVGTGGGISKFDGNNWTSYDTSDGLAFNYIRAIAIDSRGNKWIGTYKGLNKFDGNTWITYTTADGLISDHVEAIEIDKEGNIWIGTFYGGVSKIAAPPEDAENNCGECGTGTGLAFIPPIGFKIAVVIKRRKRWWYKLLKQLKILA